MSRPPLTSPNASHPSHAHSSQKANDFYPQFPVPTHNRMRPPHKPRTGLSKHVEGGLPASGAAF